VEKFMTKIGDPVPVELTILQNFMKYDVYAEVRYVLVNVSEAEELAIRVCSRIKVGRGCHSAVVPLLVNA
jgi:hypothetical protein